MAAIIGFESRMSGETVEWGGYLSYITRWVAYGHIAFEDDSGQIYGFSPDPLPEVIDIWEKYPACYSNQTRMFSILQGKVKIERFAFDMNWYDEAYMHLRLRGNESGLYCMRAPIRGPPYNCISYLREVVGVGELPQTNLLAEVFAVLRARK